MSNNCRIIIDRKDLEGFTDYTVTITAENSDGRGPSSNAIHFKTLEDGRYPCSC